MFRSALACTLLAVLAAAPRGQADLIGVSWSFDDSPVVMIDETTGLGTAIGSSGFPYLNSLAGNEQGVLFTANDWLITINPTTGEGTLVVPIDLGDEPISIRSLAFSPSGILYAANQPDRVSFPPHDLYTIDLETGQATLVGNVGFHIQGLAFSPDGVLYGWDAGHPDPDRPHDGLVTIDTVTGSGTDVNPSIGGGPGIQSIVFTPEGNLFGARDVLYRIDRNTGEYTAVAGSEGFSDVRGLAFIPEPATLSLLALGALAVVRRKER